MARRHQIPSRRAFKIRVGIKSEGDDLLRNIPNIISFARLLLVGVFIYLFVNGEYAACLITYVVAFLSDILDGYLARRNGWITNIGKLLDPLADKLMLITALVCFYCAGWLPLWIPVIAAAKELLMIIGGAFLLKRKVVVYADWFGKVAAGLFAAGVVLTLLKHFYPPLGELYLDIIVFCAAILCAIIAMFHYAKAFGLIGKKTHSE